MPENNYRSMKKNVIKIAAAILIPVFFSLHAYAQVYDGNLNRIYDGVLTGYLSIFSAIDDGRGVFIDREKFASHFAAKTRVHLDNDFEKDPSYRPDFRNPTDYLDKITETFANTNAIINPRIHVEDDREKLLFGKKNDLYFAWYSKTISFGPLDNMTVIDNWSRITIREVSPGVFKITEITVVEKPRDSDNDQIVDMYDQCRSTASGQVVNINGCNNYDRDEDGVPDKVDACPDDPGRKTASGCPDSDGDGVKDSEDYCSKKGPASNGGCPISELNIGVYAGANMPFGTAYSNNLVLNNQTYQFSNKGNFAKWGLMFDVSLQYHFSTWLGLEVGCMDFSNAFDEAGLQSNIETFLGRNGIVYNNVAVNADAYRFFLGYVKLSLGNFSGENNIVKVQPMVGQAFKG
ncbi:MAG: hypothetical protein EOO01_20395, partial [Chitinophagaceae bacterium]